MPQPRYITIRLTDSAGQTVGLIHMPLGFLRKHRGGPRKRPADLPPPSRKPTSR